MLEEISDRIKGKVRMIKKDELFKGSLILLILLNLFNLFNVLFQFGSARLLGPESYGIMGVLMGLVYLFTVPSEGIQTVISRYTTKFMRDKGKIKNLISFGLRKFSFYGFAFFLAFLIISPLLSVFLRLDLALIVLSGIVLLCFFLLPVGRGVLQGTKRFARLGLTFFSEGFLKFCLAILFILIGFGVAGPILAIIIALIFSFILALFFARDLLKNKRKDERIEGIKAYSWPVFISIACLTAFISLDVILVKRFFSLQEVGYYAAISMMGKLIYFGTNPISRALFPLASERHDQNKKASDLLKKALLFTLLIAVIVTGIYFLIPGFLVLVIYGKEYEAILGLIGYAALIFSLLSFSQMYVFYYISTNKKMLNWVLILGVIVQVFFILLLHKTLGQFMLAIGLSNLVLLGLLASLGFVKTVD